MPSCVKTRRTSVYSDVRRILYHVSKQNSRKFVCVSLCTLRRIVCIGNDIPGGNVNFRYGRLAIKRTEEIDAAQKFRIQPIAWFERGKFLEQCGRDGIHQTGKQTEKLRIAVEFFELSGRGHRKQYISRRLGIDIFLCDITDGAPSFILFLFFVFIGG